jgi:hypothetical protein
MQNDKSGAVTSLIAILIVVGAHLVAAQTVAQTTAPAIPPPTDAPPALAVPAGLEPVLLAHASGSQIYTCKAGADGSFSWTLKSPDAELHDRDRTLIGHHSAGPCGS